MLSLAPSASLHAENASQIVTRAPLAPVLDRTEPRNLAALPPAIRSLPADLQVAALCDMLADARRQLDRSSNHVALLGVHVSPSVLLSIVSR